MCMCLAIARLSLERKAKKKRTLRVGFEPTREDHIGFQVQRLNRSAIAAVPPSIPNQNTIIPQCSKLSILLN